MAGNPVKEQEVSTEEIKHDYNPHRHSICASFLRAYKPYFIKNFNKICKDKCTCDHCLTELNIESDYFYDVMFNPDEDLAEADVRSIFHKLIHHTAHTDIILNQAWLQMIDDYVSGVRRLKGRVDEISTLTALMNELFRLLDEVYFEISRQVNIVKPRVDKTAEQYLRQVTKFNKYIEDKTDNDGVTNGLKVRAFYHSTPVDMAATVDRVDTDSVTFNIHPYVSIALQRVAVAFVTSPLHDDVFKVYADHIDVKKRKATFSSFTSHDHESDNRRHVRVALSRITRALIIGKEFEAEGIIYDMSEASCAIYVRNAPMNKFEPGSPVRFMAGLPDTSGVTSFGIDTMGTILQSYKQGENDLRAYRIVIRYDNDPAFIAELASYVSSRQREIIRELKDLSEGEFDADSSEDNVNVEE